MKKSFSKSVLVVLVMLVMASGAIFADSNAADDVLALSGSIDQILELSIAANSNASAIDLSGGEADLLVATGTVDSNTVTGFKIKATSVNYDTTDGARFLNDDGTADFFVPYSLTFGGTAVVFDNTTFFFTSAANTTFESEAYDILLTVTADNGTYVAGDYDDTVTFTIEAQ